MGGLVGGWPGWRVAWLVGNLVGGWPGWWVTFPPTSRFPAPWNQARKREGLEMRIYNMNIAIVLVSEISRPKVDYYCLFVSVLPVLPWCAGHSTMLRGYWRHCLCIASLITPCPLPTSLRCVGVCREEEFVWTCAGRGMCVGVCVCRVQEGLCVDMCREGYVCGRVCVQSAGRRIVCGHV